jgi:hypothetical protein
MASAIIAKELPKYPVRAFEIAKAKFPNILKYAAFMAVLNFDLEADMYESVYNFNQILSITMSINTHEMIKPLKYAFFVSFSVVTLEKV